ncbi:MAG: methyltransferase domain-containing protein [Pseudonocardiaceae bacterium]|nr:methyltransferase domain-containing protein [Pseudonocardiaceae bacterium]
MTDTTTPANADEIRYWTQVEGPHYVVEAERYDLLLRAFTEALLDAAALHPGERVLDVGCGNGATTIEAARQVRPGGRALGVDVSPPMLALAGKRAAAAGVDTVEFLRADAQVHAFDEGSVDAIISRNGLMFFDDPNAAFANLARALRPGARVVFVAPQGPKHSEWIMAAGAAAAPYLGVPQGLAPNAPGPYGLADPDRTRGILAGAGFGDVTVEALTRPMRIGDDVEDALGFIRSLPRVADLFAAAPPDKRTAAISAVREALAPYAGPDGVVMHNNGEWLVTARR